MNIYQAYETFLTYAAVAGGVACTAILLCWTLRRELHAALDRWLALGPVGRCATALFASVFVIYGSTKAPTNSPPNGIGGGAPQMNAPLAGLHLPLPALMPPPPLSAALSTNEQWLARGAWNDWKRIDFPDGFAFPLGTNLLYSVTLMSQGSLRDALANPSPFAALPAALSLEPEASTVAYGPTPSNSFVFAWSNACIDREPTNRVDASIELFASGDMAIRFGDAFSFVPAQPPEGFVGLGQDAARLSRLCRRNRRERLFGVAPKRVRRHQRAERTLHGFGHNPVSPRGRPLLPRLRAIQRRGGRSRHIQFPA